MSIDDPLFVRITLGEHLPEHGSIWFDGMQIRNLPDGHAVLLGMLADQSALFGVLIRIRDLGLHLISLNQCNQRECREALYGSTSPL